MNSAGWYGADSGACEFGGGFNGGGYGTYAGNDGGAYGGGGGYGMPWGENGGGAQCMDGGGKGDFKGKGSGKSASFNGGAGQGKGWSSGWSKGDSKGGGGGKGVCKFFLQGRCTRGASCAFSHTMPGEEEDEEPDDPDMLEIQAAIAKARGQPNEEEEEMFKHLDQLEADDGPDKAGTDDGGSSSGDPLPPPASEAEIEEAQRIVQKAQEELIERNKMKAKVKDCSQDDLAAMINARLARK